MKPIDYLKSDYHDQRHWALNDRSKKIVEFFQKYVDKDDIILELGCSSGRNLVALMDAGYRRLDGLEMFPVQDRKEFNLIRERWENWKPQEYDVVFSASFLQEFYEFPQELFNKTLEITKKYFMIFGDYLGKWEHPGFEIVEQIPAQEPFSQPIIILKRNETT